jgi:hypothetical protein
MFEPSGSPTVESSIDRSWHFSGALSPCCFTMTCAERQMSIGSKISLALRGDGDMLQSLNSPRSEKNSKGF